jgi:hypothetical protein
MRAVLALTLIAAGLGLAGCEHPSAVDSARIGPFFKPINFAGDARLPLGFRRVVLLPIHADPYAGYDTAEMLDPVIAEALVKEQRFEVVPLSRADCARSFGTPDIDSTSALPHDFLTILGQKFGAQGVLFVDLTAYAPYRPLAIGFRSKLAAVASGRIIWSFDELFSTNNSAVANSVRRYYLGGDRQSEPFDPSPDNLTSPRRFAGYVADAAFRTMPTP